MPDEYAPTFPVSPPNEDTPPTSRQEFPDSIKAEAPEEEDADSEADADPTPSEVWTPAP
jgi:hypothetical protein